MSSFNTPATRDVIYTFYVESNSVGKPGLSPTISAMLNVETGTGLSNLPTITELSEGFYKFTYGWTGGSADAYLSVSYTHLRAHET